MEDAAVSISGEVTCIKVIQGTVTAQVFPLRCARIDISYSLVIREKVNALSHPARISNIASQVKQTLKVPTTDGIAPEVSYFAPTIAFPVGRLANVTSQYYCSMRTIGNRVCHPEGK
jgi:hypothetical protein